MSVSRCEFKTCAQGKGNQTCCSSVQTGPRGSVQVGAYTYCLILPKNAYQRAHPMHSGVEEVCSDAVLSHFNTAMGLSQQKVWSEHNNNPWV